MIAVIDCNNFFVSCERVFRPDLAQRPVAVLSNNDGCFVSRSNEVKALGIPMGAPAFEYETTIKQNQIQLFSANFTLYADLSHRIMCIIKHAFPQTEIYSIDEAFVDLQGITKAKEIMLPLRKKLLKTTGIPTSIGIATTKTLAKAANEIAKKHPSGVIICEQNDDQLLTTLPVSDIWGIGSKLSEFLQNHGIKTAYDLKNANDRWLKEQKNVMLQRTVWELRGKTCFPVQNHQSAQKSISTTRTFGNPLEKKQELQQALATYASRVGHKLRTHNLRAGAISVFVRTNQFNEENQLYWNSHTAYFDVPSSYTPELIKKTVDLLKYLYRPGYQYKQTGITVHHLVPKHEQQTNLFRTTNIEQEDALMKAVDTINQQWGDLTVRSAIADKKTLWSNKDTQCSPAYTTQWNQLPTVWAR